MGKTTPSCRVCLRNEHRGILYLLGFYNEAKVWMRVTRLNTVAVWKNMTSYFFCVAWNMCSPASPLICQLIFFFLIGSCGPLIRGSIFPNMDLPLIQGVYSFVHQTKKIKRLKEFSLKRHYVENIFYFFVNSTLKNSNHEDVNAHYKI